MAASLATAAIAALGLALSGGAVADPAAPERSERAKKKSGTKVRVAKSRYGKIVVDGKGLTLYGFTKDVRKKQKTKCYGACAVAWPPLYSKGKPVAKGQARQNKLGVTKRRDGGKQVTYNGWPLYYYVDEDAPGEIFCQNVFQFGGLWLVVDRRGDLVRGS